MIETKADRYFQYSLEYSWNSWSVMFHAVNLTKSQKYRFVYVFSKVKTSIDLKYYQREISHQIRYTVWFVRKQKNYKSLTDIYREKRVLLSDPIDWTCNIIKSVFIWTDVWYHHLYWIGRVCTESLQRRARVTLKCCILWKWSIVKNVCYHSL